MTVEAESDSRRDYVAYMECHAEGSWLPKLTSQLDAWLESKNLGVDLTEAANHTLGNTTLSTRTLDGDDVRELKFTLIEKNPKLGSFTTDLLAHQGPGADNWISLSVRNSTGAFVNVPRLARSLAAVLSLRDGSLTFSDRPLQFGEDDLDRLITILADGRRHGLVFVVGTADTFGDIAPFVDRVSSWSKEVAGLAQVIVLDPAATSAFRRRVGEDFEAPVWAIRGYQPGVLFDQPADSRRHRYVTLSWLARVTVKQIQLLLGDIARQQTMDRLIDESEQQARRRFARLENRRLVETLVESEEEREEPAAPLPPSAKTTPEPSPEAETPPTQAPETDEAQKQLTLVRRILGIGRITEQALREVLGRLRGEARSDAVAALERRVDELQAAFERVEDENRELTEALSDAELEVEVTRIDLDGAAGQMRWLESRLNARGDYESQHASVPPEYATSSPRDFEELLDRIEKLDTVQFTGDATEVIKLKYIDTNDTALRRAWDAVLVMNDYVRARREGVWGQGLEQYIQHTPPGFTPLPAKRFAETETAATMQAHGAARMFRVPTTIAPTGRVAMKAHFKLGRIGRKSPRMHVFDGHPHASCFYIGYIGVHLPIAQAA